MSEDPMVTGPAPTPPEPPTVHCRSIEVHQALGIRHGEGFEVTDFCRGINLVLAPNSTGKTTMARTLALLAHGGGKEAWRQLRCGAADVDASYRRLYVSATFVITAPDGGGETQQWNVAVSAGHIEQHLDGKAHRTQPQDIALSPRYCIALPDLLVDEGGGFSRQILEHASGGIRWAELQRDLGWKDPPPQPKRLVTDRGHAHANWAKATKDQRKADSEVQELPRLRQQRTELREKLRRQRDLERVQERRKLQHGVDELIEQIEAHRLAALNLAGTERETATRLKEDLGLAEKELRKVKNNIMHMEAHAPAPLTEEERRADIDLIRGLVEDFEVQDSQLAEANRAHEAARSKANEARSRLISIGAAVPPSNPNDIPLRDFLDAGNAVARATWKAGAATAGSKLAEAQVDLLKQRWGSDSTWIAASDDDLTNAIRLLSRWLQQQRAPSAMETSITPIFIVLGLIFVSGAAGVLPGLSGSVPALFGVAFAALAFFILLAWLLSRRASSKLLQDRGTDEIREEYEELAGKCTGMLKPASWSIPDVIRAHAELLRAASQAERLRLLDNVGKWVGEAQSLVTACTDTLLNSRQSLAKITGITIASSDLLWASNIAQLCNSWLEAMRDVEVQGDRKASAEEQFEESKRNVLRSLTDAGCKVPDGPVRFGAKVARSLFDGLAERITARKRYERERLQPELDRERDCIAEAERARKKYDGFLRDFPGGPVTDDELPGLLQGWDELSAIRHQLKANQELLDKQPPEPAEFHGKSDDEIRRTLDDIPEQIELERDLVERIAALEQQENSRGAGHSVADAWDKLVRANLELRERELADLETVIGREVVAWARRQAHTSLAPPVLQRARQHAARFTAGRLEFEVDTLDDRKGPEFRVRSSNEPWRNVSELSSGERVQLLLAVRLAFLEEGESMRLPLILDEVLASSDDERGAYIMDTVIDVAKNGRQVLYLSSQSDEIDKWQARAQESGVPLRLIRLADIRGISASQSRPPRRPVPPTPSVPSPDGRTRQQYGEDLKVPGVDWGEEQLVSLHLWYLLPDVSELHRQLKLGATTLGQLEQLASHHANPTVQDAWETARPRVIGFRAAASALRIGLGKRLGTETLYECGLISDNFRDRVHACLDKSAGDAHQFLEFVKELQGFQRKSSDKLKSWLEENEYLVDADRLSRDEIHGRVLAAILGAGVPEDECRALVDEIMVQLP